MKSNLFFCIFFWSLFASSSSNCSWARSTSETTSPIPNIRSAILAGWNTSNASIFSPVPINFIGLVTTVRIDNAAPPRVSPSSLVNTTPSKSNLSLNSFAVFTASWPVIESTTNKTSSGFTCFFRLSISSIISASTAKRPAVSIITTSFPLDFASFIAFSAIAFTFLLSGSLYTGTSTDSPTTFNCWIAAGRYTSQATSNGFLCSFVFNRLANLPENVVLPEPCNPLIKIMAGLFSNFKPTDSPPINFTNSSWTIFTISCPGFTAVKTFIPKAFCFTVSVNDFATL